MNENIVLDDPKEKILLRCLKSAFYSLVVSLVLILIFAFIIKLTGISDGAIMPINQAIKAVSIFCGIIIGMKKYNHKLYLKGALIGILYILLAFLAFSILNGKFNFNKNIITDLIFGGVMGIIAGIIANLIKKK